MRNFIIILLVLLTFTTNAQRYSKVAPSEYATYYIGADAKLYSAGGNLQLLATGNSGNQGVANLCKGQSASTLPLFSSVYAGLDDAVAIDTFSNVWHLGATSSVGDGSYNPPFTGTGTNYYYAVPITVDSAGNPFTGIIMVCQYWLTYSARGWIALKSNGTLWIWGSNGASSETQIGQGLGLAGFRGLGNSYTLDTMTRPVQVPIPGGRNVTSIRAGQTIIAMCSDGSVFSWGGGACSNYGPYPATNCNALQSGSWKSPQQVVSTNGPITGAIAIAGGRDQSFILCGSDSLWGWGNGCRLGLGRTNCSPEVLPIYLSGRIGLPHPISKIEVNVNAVQVILSDSSLYGFGSSPQGEVGNGIQINRDQQPYPNYYGWNYYSDSLVASPVNLVQGRHDFTKIYGATAYTYWMYDEAVNGQLYFNGRNKGAIAGNGIINQDTTSGLQAATFDNGWNVATASPVNIFSLRSSILVPAPPCVVSSSYNGCSDYVAQPYHASTLSAGSNQTGIGSTTTLTGTSTPFSGRKIASYVWSQISGPSVAYFNTFNDSVASVSRLQAGGVYVFMLTATDNLNSVTTANVSVTTAAGGGGNTPPTAAAGNDQTITLPSTQVTLAGSGAGTGGATIVSYQWTLVSGNAATITNPNTASTTVTGLTTTGVRIYRLTVTDNHGLTAQDDVQITVNGSTPGTGTETNDFITYDTTVVFPSGSWNLRISRPRNMFVAGNPDTASRPSIVFMVGLGEAADACNSGYKPTCMTYFGPHAILNYTLTDLNGVVSFHSGSWNGGIQLGNGTHYPIIISTQPFVGGPTANSVGSLILHLLSYYHIKQNSLHLTGLSMGAYSWTLAIGAERTVGDFTYMKHVRSIAALQGFSNAYQFYWAVDPGNPSNYWSRYQLGGDIPVLGGSTDPNLPPFIAFGYWAHHYGGKYFGMNGTPPDYFRGAQLPAIAMNDSLVGSAYYMSENIGGGTHGYWDIMYDPANTNWNSVNTPLSPYYTTFSNYPSYQGTYQYGDYIYKWMIKQGDTTLVGSGNQSPIAFAGNNQSITLPTSSVTLSGSGIDNDGTVTSYSWSQITGTTATILSPSSASTVINGLTPAGVRVFRLTVTDNGGAQGTSDVTITVNAVLSAYPIVSSTSLSTSTSSASLSSSVTSTAGISRTTWTKFVVPGQTLKRMVVVGSSTSAGVGATIFDSSFVGKLRAYYRIQGICDTIYNDSAPGSAPWDHNITTSLINNPNVCLLNFPSNQFFGNTTAYIMGQFQKWADSCALRGIQFYVTGTQPRDDFSTAAKLQLIVIDDSLRNRFGSRFIELLYPLSVNPADTTMKPVFAYGDGVHVNDAGHEQIYQLVRGSNVFQNYNSSASIVSNTGAANTTVNGLVNGTHKFQVSVIDNNGYAASSVATITANISSNSSPSANAGASQTITLPLSQTTLSGAGTDVDGTIVSYAWTQISGIAAVIGSPFTSATNITGMTTAGVRVFRLTVTDNGGATGISDVSVTVNALITGYAGVQIPIGKYTFQLIDANGHVTAIGNRGFTGVGGNGAEAGSVGIPEPVIVTPSNLKFKGGSGHFHGAALIDTSGHLWTTGATEGGESGMGNITYSPFAQKILVDTLGNAFDSVVSVVALAVNGGEGTDQNGYMALKSSGTIWVWGTLGSMLATGTANDTRSYYRPVRIPIPGGRSAMQIAGGYHCMILCTDSTVWTYGGIDAFDGPNLGYTVTSVNQIASLHQIVIPGSAGVKYIAGGGDFNYELTSDNKLYGHGKFGVDMCNQSTVIYTPTELTNVTNFLPASISKIVVSQDATSALLTNGQLWTWGDNTQAGIGNGQQYYGFGRDTTHGYAWTYQYNLLTVTTPYHVAPTRTFTNMFSGNLLTFNTIALGSDGQLYEWGTNKGCTIADQISGPPSGNLGFHDQSWNRMWPTPINPQAITTQYITTSPACVFGYSDSTWCDTYNWRALPRIKPTANAGPNQSINISTATLDGSNSSDDVFVSYYLWSQVSGPNTAVMDLPASKRPIISNLTTGIYVFKLLVIDNEWLYDSAFVRIAVNSVDNQPPTAYAGADTTVVLPQTTIPLNGSGSLDPEGGVLTYHWVLLSGPSSVSFTPSANQAIVTSTLGGAGTYRYQLTVTDDGGLQSSSIKVVTVNGNQLPIANAGPAQGITLPTSQVTLTGSGTDIDGTIVGYLWAQVSGPAATIASSTSATTLITGLTAGTFIFRLIVTDNNGGQGTNDVIITVNPAGTPPPTVTCAGNQTITLPVNQVTLSATATNAVTYAWTQTAGTAATIATPSSLITDITALTTSGNRTFLLTVTDGQGRTATCSNTVTVNPAPAIKTIPGTIQAENYDVSVGPQYAIPTTDVSGVQEIVGIMQNSYLDYNVTVSTTGTYSVTFRVATLQAPQFKIIKGTDTLKTVNITSTGGWSTWGNVTVTGVSLTAGAQTLRILSTNTASCNFNYMTYTLTTGGNQPPTANAGSNQAVILPTSTATLSGSGSTGSGGTSITYGWIQVGGTTASIVNPTSASTGISGLNTVGTRVFQLTVTQNDGLTATSIVFVVVGETPTITIPVKGFLVH